MYRYIFGSIVRIRPHCNSSHRFNLRAYMDGLIFFNVINTESWVHNLRLYRL